MASKLKQKKPEVILKAIVQSTKPAIKASNVYQYDVEKPVSGDLNIYHKSFLLRPWLIFLAINFIALLVLVSLGYGIGLGISSAYSKLHGDFCNSTIECSQSDKLLCVDNTCTCPTTKYFNGITCADRFTYGAACTNFYPNECGYGLVCYYSIERTNGVCNCSNERFWNTQTNYCDLKYSYNQNGCTNSNQCSNGANMVCSGSVCTCGSTNFWNGTHCGLIATYMQNCSIEINCDTTKLLNCSLVGENLFKCLCPDTYYWSSNNCISKVSYISPCSDSIECREDLGLTCTGQCSCLNTHYWDGLICKRKLQFNVLCNINDECDDNIGLTCSGSCVCNNLYFYNGTGCQFKLISGLNCDSSFDCDDSKSLECDNTTKQCICPTNYFWDYSTCVVKRLSNQDCVHNIQCRDDLGLHCDVNETKKCICLSTHYWNEICKTCSLTVNCQDYKGLVCNTSTCVCDIDYYWNSEICVKQVLFNEPCIDPHSDIMCMESKGLGCNSSICRCIEIDHYWDSITCVPKLEYNAYCQFQVTTLENSQCNDISPKFLKCRAVDFATNTFKCLCPSDRRWHIDSCVLKMEYNQSCSSDSECQDYNGLICNPANNTCLCPSIKYWNSTDKICKHKLPIHSPCTFASSTEEEQCQDYAWLYCNTVIFGTCQCPPNRYYNENFKACLPRASHNQYCGDGTLCMPSSPRELTCLPEAGFTCQCENYRSVDNPYYWSRSEKNCRACPIGYLSGYGYDIQNSGNSITSRCYRVEYSKTFNFNDAQAKCAENSAHLMNIRNTMEMGVAAFWSSGTRSFWVEAISDGTNFIWQNWSSNVDPNLWCRAEPSSTALIQRAYIHGDRGDCLDQSDEGTHLYYICEYGT